MSIWNIRIYIYDIAANFLDSCRFYFKKKTTQKTEVKDVGAGMGEGGLLSLSGITRMLLQELMPRLDLQWTDLEYF